MAALTKMIHCGGFSDMKTISRQIVPWSAFAHSGACRHVGAAYLNAVQSKDNPEQSKSASST